MEIPTECDMCGAAVEWVLVNTTEAWDFYRAYCVRQCDRSLRSEPRGATNHATRKVRHGLPL